MLCSTQAMQPHARPLPLPCFPTAQPAHISLRRLRAPLLHRHGGCLPAGVARLQCVPLACNCLLLWCATAVARLCGRCRRASATVTPLRCPRHLKGLLLSLHGAPCGSGCRWSLAGRACLAALSCQGVQACLSVTAPAASRHRHCAPSPSYRASVCPTGWRCLALLLLHGRERMKRGTRARVPAFASRWPNSLRKWRVRRPIDTVFTSSSAPPPPPPP
jgi:hypothetical protein